MRNAQNFNSIMVRLKVGVGVGTRSLVTDFNSIMVRLKANMCGITVGMFYEFQFHHGAIKRLLFFN